MNLICKHCNKTISYEKEDIKNFFVNDTFNMYYYINCPMCKKPIKMLKTNILLKGE